VSAALDAAIDEVLETMSDEQHAEPRFFPDNYQAWTEFFRRRYEWELAAYDGPPSSRVQQRRRLPPLVERAGPHPRGHARAHRGWQLARPGDAAAAFSVAPPRELVDVTADCIPLLRIGVEVGITLVGITLVGGKAGAAVRTADQKA
jgi:hypothetical protein